MSNEEQAMSNLLPERVEDFRSLMRLEVLSEDRFKRSPLDSSQEEKWRVNLLPPDFPDEERPLLPARTVRQVALDSNAFSFPLIFWGDPEVDFSTARPEPRVELPLNTRVHPDLRELLEVMQEVADLREHGFTGVQVVNGGPSGSQVETASPARVLAEQDAKKDPAELGLLRRLGRSADVALLPDPDFAGVPSLTAFMDAVYGETAFLNHQIHVLRLKNADRLTDMAYFRLSLQPVVRRVNKNQPDPDVTDVSPDQVPDIDPQKLYERETALSFRQFRRNFRALGYQTEADNEGEFLEDSDLNATMEDYLLLVDRMLSKRPFSVSAVAYGAAFYTDKGSMDRPLAGDGTVAAQIFYDEPLARRFAYQVKRQSRYLDLYRELGLLNEYSIDFEAGAGVPDSPVQRVESLKLRLPRVKVPVPPSISYIGQTFRPRTGESPDVEFRPFAEWKIKEHPEEVKVRANETLRNRLGYRGLAWSLFASVDRNWLTQSGWDPEFGPIFDPDPKSLFPWFVRDSNPTDGGLPGFSDLPFQSEEERSKHPLFGRAEWPDVTSSGTGDSGDDLILHRGSGLEEPPFRGLLLPKATVLRVPALPYYYTYRLASFCRTDDLDSVVAVSEANALFPAFVPRVNTRRAGWQRHHAQDMLLPGHTRLLIWWEVPAVWDSLDPEEQALWSNEFEFARRLWDFELQFTIQTRYQGTIFPLATLTYDKVLSLGQAEGSPQPGEVPEINPSKTAIYTGKTAGGHLYMNMQGDVEDIGPMQFPDPQHYFIPRLEMIFIADETLTRLLNSGRFAFELKTFRDRGPALPSITPLTERTFP